VILLTEISPFEMTKEDHYWFAKGCIETNWRKMDPLEHLTRCTNFECTLLRVSGDAQGIMTGFSDDGRFIINLMAGEGFMKHFPAIHEKLLAVAAGRGCKKLAGYVERPGLKRFYDRFWTRARPVMTLYEENVYEQ